MNVIRCLFILLLLAALSGCTTIPHEDSRAFNGLSKAETILLVRDGLTEQSYLIEELNVGEGYVKAISPEFERSLLWIFPWRKDRWTVTLHLEPVEKQEGYVLSMNADIEERGIFDTSEWIPREELPGDKAYMLELRGKLDSLLLSRGASFQ